MAHVEARSKVCIWPAFVFHFVESEGWPAIRSSEHMANVLLRRGATEGTILRSEPPGVWSGKTAILVGFLLPKVAVGKCVTGTTFKITFKLLRLLESFDCNIYFQLPWYTLCRVITSARIMFGDTLFQVRSVSNVAMLWMADAFNDIGIKHPATLYKMACHPKLGTYGERPPSPGGYGGHHPTLGTARRRFRA
jgi:hypothetical protein